MVGVWCGGGCGGGGGGGGGGVGGVEVVVVVVVGVGVGGLKHFLDRDNILLPCMGGSSLEFCQNGKIFSTIHRYTQRVHILFDSDEQ